MTWTLNDQMQVDTQQVFFREGECVSLHVIDGVEVLCDIQEGMGRSQAVAGVDGAVMAMAKRVFVEESLLEVAPMTGKRMVIDGDNHQIVNVSRQDGKLVISVMEIRGIG